MCFAQLEDEKHASLAYANFKAQCALSNTNLRNTVPQVVPCKLVTSRGAFHCLGVPQYEPPTLG